MNSTRDYIQLRTSHAYERTTPSVFNAVSQEFDLLRWFFREISQDQVAVPSEGYIYLPTGYIFDGRYALDADFQWVEETLSDWGISAEAKIWIQQEMRDGQYRPLNQTSADWYYVMFFQCNSENYGHFLCEAAPKLMHLARAGVQKVKYLVPEQCERYTSVIERVLTHLGILSEPIPVAAGSFICLRHVLYFTPVSKHNFRKSQTLLDFREVLLSLFGRSGTQNRKIFITRAPTDRRRIANQEEIEQALHDQGYQSVYPGTMTVEQQVELFAQTIELVGSVGAGLTNMLFCPKNTNIFYICNGILDFFFWDIAGLCQQNFAWFFAKPLKSFDQETFVGDFFVDKQNFTKCLELFRNSR